MNISRRRIIRTTGYTFIGVALFMVPSLLYALFTDDLVCVRAFAIPVSIMLLLGLIMRFAVKPPNGHIWIRDGYLNIFIIMFISAIAGAVPYFLGIPGCGVIDAIFESTAGLSTTSASVLYEPSLPYSMMLWKAIEHWIGGLCVLIFIISLLPQFGLGDQQISTVESHGTYINKIAPKSSLITKYIIGIYAGFTVIAFVYFMICCDAPFDAVMLALASTSTSGVLIHPEGISYYDSFLVETGVSIFTILSSISFVLYIHIIKKHYSEVKRNIEIRAFIGIIVVSTFIIALILFFSNTGKDFVTSLRDSFFQTASFITTSGFALEDYTAWPSAACFVLMLMMLIGGCSASTTGAFKVIRLLIVEKLIERGFLKHMHPRAVHAVKVGNSTISADTASSVTSFAILYLAVIIISTVILSLQNIDLETSFSAVIGTISNDGISFGQIGMGGDYSMFHPLLKIYLCFLMIVGRLGLMTMLLIFLPSFWKSNKKSRHHVVKA